MGQRLQKFLRGSGTIERLKKEYSIDSYKHPDFPIVGFKYHPTKSPKTSRMADEANGCIFRIDDWDLIAKGIDRIRSIDDMDPAINFDWSNFGCFTKEIGTTVLLFNYASEWIISADGSFGAGKLKGYNGTIQDLFWKCAGNLRGKLCRAGIHNSYVFKLCTPFNSLRKHSKPNLILIGANHITHRTANVIDYDRRSLKAESITLDMPLAGSLMLYSKREINNFLAEKEKTDPTFCGVVIKDIHYVRYKAETKSYKTFNQLYDNGNIVKAKNLTSIVMSNKQDKVLEVWPDLKPALTEVSEILDKAFADLAEAWLSNKDVETRKEFAVKVKDSPFFFILFSMLGKHGAEGTVDQLKALWVKDHLHEKIAKKLFDGRVFEFDRSHVANVAAVA